MAADKQTTPNSAPPSAPWTIVAGFAPHLRIAHQIAGRVRLKLDAAALDDPFLRTLGIAPLRAALGAVPGVRDIQLNLLARSCLLVYDNAVIPDQAWPDLLAGERSAAAATLLGLLSAAATAFPRTIRRKENAS